jgi:hypothetical protein
MGDPLAMRGHGSTLRILGPVELIGPAGPVRLGAARPLLDAAVDQFALIGMAGWLRRAKAAGGRR